MHILSRSIHTLKTITTFSPTVQASVPKSRISTSSIMTVPTTCCGRSSESCVCAAQAKCSCGKQSALNCNCEKAETENAVAGARCSCREWSSPTIYHAKPATIVTCGAWILPCPLCHSQRHSLASSSVETFADEFSY